MHENEIYITKYVEEIKQKALFLEIKGFSVVEVSEFIIKYVREDSCYILIYYGRYSDRPEVSVRIENKGSKPEQYSIGWFKNIKKFESGEKDIFEKIGDNDDKLTIIFSLLKYVESNLDKITDVDFCRNTQNKINENFTKGI